MLYGGEFKIKSLFAIFSGQFLCLFIYENYFYTSTVHRASYFM
jgi:hypothetical protein